MAVMVSYKSWICTKGYKGGGIKVGKLAVHNAAFCGQPSLRGRGGIGGEGGPNFIICYFPTVLQTIKKEGDYGHTDLPCR